jgi:hypothetical protein
MHQPNFNLFSFLIFESWIHIDFFLPLYILELHYVRTFTFIAKMSNVKKIYTSTCEDVSNDVLHSPFGVH